MLFYILYKKYSLYYLSYYINLKNAHKRFTGALSKITFITKFTKFTFVSTFSDGSKLWFCSLSLRSRGRMSAATNCILTSPFLCRNKRYLQSKNWFNTKCIILLSAWIHSAWNFLPFPNNWRYSLIMHILKIYNKQILRRY